MTARGACLVLALAGLAGGTWLDRPRTPAPVVLDDFRVLEADFHVHSFFGDGVLSPFNVVLEARRQGLHALALTNHNQVFSARAARRFSRLIDGPIVLVGQEVTAPDWHVIAAGIERTIDWRQPVEQAIARIHEQGGVAIAAHPVKPFWAGFSDRAIEMLDGVERMHPLVYVDAEERDQLLLFYDRARRIRPDLAAIGSSDFHFLNWLGLCRTLVFVDRSDESGVIDAVRQGRTVVFDPAGEPHGDPAMIELLDRHRYRPTPPRAGGEDPSVADLFVRIAGWIGLLGLTALGRETRSPC